MADSEEVLDDDLEPTGEGDQVEMLITPEQRKKILGRLAEFEVMLSELVPRQQGFVLAILEDPTSHARAAVKAGYSEYSANVMASKLMAMPKIQAVIAAGQVLREDRTWITSDRTLNEIAIIAFSNIGDFEVLPGTNNIRTKEGVPEYAMRAIASAEFTSTIQENEDGTTKTVHKTRIKLWSKNDALRMLMMYQNLLRGDVTNLIDNRGGTINQSATHNYQHNEWVIGDKKVRF